MIEHDCKFYLVVRLIYTTVSRLDAYLSEKVY